jgi:THUMP domain-like/Methyltransferase domain
MLKSTTFKALLEPAGQRLLDAATALVPTPATLLQCTDKLRKHFPTDLVPLALEQVLLRQKAKAKFDQAERMYFTRELLEMATSERVARHRAIRFAKYRIVLDLCCGLGGDALALAHAGCKVIAWDSDPMAVMLCRENARFHNLDITVEKRDAIKEDFPQHDATFIDPARRHDGRRHVSISEYLPAPAELIARLSADHPLAIKLAPGVRVEEAEALRGELEFVSLDGELKEAVLWHGELQSCSRRASVITQKTTHTLLSTSRIGLADLGVIGAFLFDPDPAVVRAGLVPVLAETIHAKQTDGLVQMLTTEDVVESPFVTTYRVMEVLPVDVKKINAACAARGIGRITLVNRGSLAEMNDVQKKLKLKGGHHAHLILTRQLGQQVAVLAERLESIPLTP